MALTDGNGVQAPALALPHEEAAPSRLTELAASLSKLRTRNASDIDLARRLGVAGGVLIPLGAVLVMLAWYGAANTSRLYLQIPYLISGGLLGVVLTVAGGFFYFAYWLTKLVTEQRSQTEEALTVARETADSLARIEALLERVAGDPPATDDAAPAGRRRREPLRT